MSCAQANVTTSLLTDYTHCENYSDSSHFAFRSVRKNFQSGSLNSGTSAHVNLGTFFGWFLRKTLKSVRVCWSKSERTVEKKYFPGRRLLWSRSRRKHWICRALQILTQRLMSSLIAHGIFLFRCDGIISSTEPCRWVSQWHFRLPFSPTNPGPKEKTECVPEDAPQKTLNL